MAYAYVCDNCLDEYHARCEKGTGSGYDVGVCVCPHYEDATKFQDEVRRTSEISRRHRSQ